MTERLKIPSDVAEWCDSSPWLVWEDRGTSLEKSVLSVPIRHPELSRGRDILGRPRLIIPLSHRHERPYVKLDDIAILKVPHIDEQGKLCLFKDEEELDYFSRTEQLSKILKRFIDIFIPAWEGGHLDQHFYDEPENYWHVYVQLYPVKKMRKRANLTAYLLSRRGKKSLRYDSYYLENLGFLCSTQTNFKTRFLSSIKSTRYKCSVFEVPIFSAFLPSDYPTSLDQLKAICRAAAGAKETQRFFHGGKPNVAKLVVFRSPTCDYGYYLPAESKLKVINPIVCERADPDWLFGRYQEFNLKSYEKSKIALIGAGSLGSHILHILAHSGIGEIHLIDSDIFMPANIGRHMLGVTSLGKAKAIQLSTLIGRDIPSCEIIPLYESVQSWLKRTDISKFDLIVDVTGERTVREVLAAKRIVQHVPLITAWMEPYITAAHVAIFHDQISWHVDGLNLWHEAHAFTGWPEDYLLSEPGCSSRFSPYTTDQLSFAAGITAEECLLALTHSPMNYVKIKSWVRGEEYSKNQKHAAERRDWAILPKNIDAAIITRQF